MLSAKFFKYGSVLLLGLLVLFGYYTRPMYKDRIVWDDRSLVWEDFKEVSYLDGDFDAAVHYGIHVPVSLSKDDYSVYAFVDPNKCEKIQDSILGDQLLTHEQYHFNLAEYGARLLRKEILEYGGMNISKTKLKALHAKNFRLVDSMNVLYDEESEHNLNQIKQNYWEVKINDLLRRTAYYDNPDMRTYRKVPMDSASYFRKIYVSLDHTILPSYPINSDDAKFGEVYQLVEMDSILTVKYYVNGQLVDGGYFDTAITCLQYNGSLTEIQYRKADSTLNSSLPVQIQKTNFRQNGDMITTYYDGDRKRTHHGVVFEIVNEKQQDGSFMSSYFNATGNNVKNKKGVYHQKRLLDQNKRTVRIEKFNLGNKPALDSDFVFRYSIQFDQKNNIVKYELFDIDGSEARHLNSYNIEYKYDEHGNVKEKTYLDTNDRKTEDSEGICTLKYTYDKFDNLTSVRKYNALDMPILALDGYFQEVSDYDGSNRIQFEAKYLPGYVLYFDDNKWGATRYKHLNDSTVLKLNLDAYKNQFNSDTGVGGIRSILNDKKQEISKVFLDYQGEFAKTEDGLVIFEKEYDDSGNLIKETTMDSLGCIQPFELDVAIVRWKYDNRNNKIQTTYYTKHDELANAEQNATYNFYDYDDDNVFIERRYYDRNMNPTEYDGSFRLKVWPNRFQKDSIIRYYNQRNQLKQGISTIRYYYNSYGTLVQESYFDRFDNRISDDNGISSIKFLLNEKQQNIGYQNYDPNNRLTNDHNGVAIEKRILNKSGFINQIEYFDKNGMPALGAEGYHKVYYEWYDSGETSTYSTFGLDGKLKENSEGIAQVKYNRYPSLLLSSSRNYDKNLHLTENNDGVAVYQYQEDLNGLYFIEKTFDADENEIIENPATEQ